MDLSFLLIQSLNGLASASALFIAACGLTIIFGVTRIVNFAHGSFYMLGAYFAAILAPRLMDVLPDGLGFWGGVLLAALITGCMGALMEFLLLRRIYKAPELLQLLATFGVVLCIQDLVLLTFGPQDILGPRAPDLRGAVTLLDQRFPTYDLFLAMAGPIVLIALWLLFKRTRFGVLIRAGTQDREMLGALGINQRVLFTAVVFLGCALAGLGGALTIPKIPANTGMDLSIIADAFVVTVIGGMGSVTGAFLAALLIGQLQAFGILIFPKITLVLVFLVMAVVLILRPQGLLGRPAPEAGGEPALMVPLPTPDARFWLIAFGLLAALAALPFIADDYTLKIATECLILAVFALSLGLLTGIGGVISFGHAAWFGIGAYAAALFKTHLGTGMVEGLILAPVVAGLAAALAGAFIVRLSGVYLAMLTLAVAQIVYAAAFQWVELTGGDNGIIGIWPAPWASERTAYFHLTLVLAGSCLLILIRIAHAPFGHALRATRDAPSRAAALGLNVKFLRWMAFLIAGTAAGLAGGLFVYSKGNVDPLVLGIPTSVDALTMALLGGLQTVLGPIVGATALHLLRDTIMPLTDYWRLILGMVIIALVLAFPKGIVGSFQALMTNKLSNRIPRDAQAERSAP